PASAWAARPYAITRPGRTRGARIPESRRARQGCAPAIPLPGAIDRGEVVAARLREALPGMQDILPRAQSIGKILRNRLRPRRGGTTGPAATGSPCRRDASARAGRPTEAMRG